MQAAGAGPSAWGAFASSCDKMAACDSRRPTFPKGKGGLPRPVEWIETAPAQVPALFELLTGVSHEQKGLPQLRTGTGLNLFGMAGGPP